MLLLSALTLVAYSFPVGTHLSYDVSVGFDGYLPVLHGRQTLASLAMTLDVFGVTPSAEGNPRIASEIKAFKLTLNGAALPFGPENVSMFFPKTTIDATPGGKLLKTDAPNLRLPIHLPGLDVKRLPDITYLPIEFPAEGIEEGKVFRFIKPFGDGPVQYEVTPTKVGPDTASFDIRIKQSYTTFEDDKKSPTGEANAATKIDTDITGEGTMSFDLKRRLATALDIEARSVGEAVDLKSQEKVERKLKTTLKVRLKLAP